MTKRLLSSIIILVRQGVKNPYERREDMEDMCSREFNQFLENIAKLIEATLKDVKSEEAREAIKVAVRIIRESKIPL